MSLKNEAIRLSKIKSVKEAADTLCITEKNIKRWLKNGPERKKGAGRKTMDPRMEHRLLDWIKDEFNRNKGLPDSKEIKSKARSFSENETFKASKGWCDKFLKRNDHLFNALREEKIEIGH